MTLEKIVNPIGLQSNLSSKSFIVNLYLYIFTDKYLQYGCPDIQFFEGSFVQLYWTFTIMSGVQVTLLRSFIYTI